MDANYFEMLSINKNKLEKKAFKKNVRGYCVCQVEMFPNKKRQELLVGLIGLYVFAAGCVTLSSENTLEIGAVNGGKIPKAQCLHFNCITI